MIGEASGALDEMGWNDAEQPEPLTRAATTGLLLVIGGVYWGSVWMLSGLSPLVHIAARVYGDQSSRQCTRRLRSR